MDPDWQNVLMRLKSYPAEVHRFLPPVSEGRLAAAAELLGPMPDALAHMLRHFNGAELFLSNGPLVSIFGLSTDPPLPPFQWAPDWHIDKFTPVWRHADSHRRDEWAIAMMNYGGLIILSEDGAIREWDTRRQVSESTRWGFAEWIEEVLCEGKAYLNE